ncbi:hypothetical protein DL240_01195 [Lujinxingia litoralis]|uniref:Uncharacterized protein n=1 Tax=Lujinxingia litoralis TaxID=2211119 RepID=A0A328C8S9_9DELT|nr:hypothetical protein [Lujinxingia litoralis]RAL24855.1 hypothetical protein DL240_01195 [Lujinxingia litoralis]
MSSVPSTYQLIWALSRHVLDDAERVRVVWALALRAAALPAQAYDLNQRGQWRAFEADRLIVDTLTQRTQMVVVRLEGGLLALATGKHGERPRLLARLDGIDDEEAARERIARISAELAGYDPEVFIRSDRLGDAGPQTWLVAGPGRVPSVLQEVGKSPLVSAEVSTSGHWQVSVGPGWHPSKASGWQQACEEISARALND